VLLHVIIDRARVYVAPDISDERIDIGNALDRTICREGVHGSVDVDVNTVVVVLEGQESRQIGRVSRIREGQEVEEQHARPTAAPLPWG